MSKFCEEARHLIIQLFGHFEENKSQFLTANHAANLAFTDNCHFLSKSHVLVPWVPEDIFFLSILIVRGEAAPTKISNRKHGLFHSQDNVLAKTKQVLSGIEKANP